MNNKKTIIYARTSTENQSNSLEDQKFTCLNYANNNGLDNIEVISDTVSGAKDSRPGFNSIIQMVKANMVSVICVSKLDRLARKISFVCNVLDLLKRHNVKLVSVKENIDTDHFTSVFLIQMLGVAAEFERNSIVERINSTKRHLARNNRILGNVRYGFKSVNKFIESDDEELKIVNTVMSLHNSGQNYSGIAKIMNRNNFKSRSGGKFYAQTVKNIISNCGG